MVRLSLLTLAIAMLGRSFVAAGDCDFGPDTCVQGNSVTPPPADAHTDPCLIQAMFGVKPFPATTYVSLPRHAHRPPQTMPRRPADESQTVGHLGPIPASKATCGERPALLITSASPRMSAPKQHTTTRRQRIDSNAIAAEAGPNATSSGSAQRLSATAAALMAGTPSDPAALRIRATNRTQDIASLVPAYRGIRAYSGPPKPFANNVLVCYRSLDSGGGVGGPSSAFASRFVNFALQYPVICACSAKTHTYHISTGFRCAILLEQLSIEAGRHLFTFTGFVIIVYRDQLGGVG
jgi:hypothetical protein